MCDVNRNELTDYVSDSSDSDILFCQCLICLSATFIPLKVKKDSYKRCAIHKVLIKLERFNANISVDVRLAALRSTLRYERASVATNYAFLQQKRVK
jgi:hypothetical protein